MPLHKIEIKGPHAGPRLLIVGGVHGDEFEPMVAAQRVAQYLQSHSDELHGQVTLIPIVNEAAFARGNRVAEDEKDLARTCPGSPNGTVTEQIAAQLSEEINHTDYFIDLHTGGTRIAVYPLAGYMLHPDSAVLEDSRRMARAFGLPIIWGTTSRLEGRSLSVARDALVPAIYAEYLGGGTCSPRGVRAYVQGCLNVLHELGMLRGEPPRFDPGTASEFVTLTIEDDRENAGHMQVQHPAPMSGLWIPEVELGAFVKTGDRIGTISSPAADVQREIVSSQTGLVLCLRTFCRVDEGEFLAVILEPRSESDVAVMQQISTQQPLFMHSVSLRQLINSI
ncbi:MAG: succinylglutamate desuccinylase [Planctomyces sp.]|nr:succinylglutamate desuccinylase [Planctomyces sp.]